MQKAITFAESGFAIGGLLRIVARNLS